MQIGKKDVLWSYAATFLKIASYALLLPFILNKMPSELVGIWAIFMTITAFGSMLDFGFNSSFTRNVTYVFSGVKNLKTNGFETIDGQNVAVNYGLLKGVVSSMRWFYSRISIVLFLLLITLGTYYVKTLLKGYGGDHQEVYIAWTILCVINTYNLYTLYYDSLLQGKGLIKRSKQIIIIGQTVYLIVAAVLIISGYGLIAIVSAQALSVIIIRRLSYRSFFTQELKQDLRNTIPHSKKEVLKAVYPNALKVGLTSIGGFFVLKSATIIGSLFLSLDDIASYGISMQLVLVIATLAGIFISTYQPKIAQLRVEQNTKTLKQIYLRGQIILIITYIIGGGLLLLLGEQALDLIRSQTQLIPQLLVFVSIIISFLESNHSIAGGILLSKNEVPFFKASLLSGGATIVLLIIFFKFTNLGLWAMIIAPGIAQGVYQNWKWPLVVYQELGITLKEFLIAIKKSLKFDRIDTSYKYENLNSDT